MLTHLHRFDSASIKEQQFLFIYLFLYFTKSIVLSGYLMDNMGSNFFFLTLKVIMEIPYVILQTILYVALTYPAIGFYWSAYKVFWYFYATFCSLLYFVYLGMLLVSMSKSIDVASILAAAIYTILNIFSGFLMPGPVNPFNSSISSHLECWFNLVNRKNMLNG